MEITITISDKTAELIQHKAEENGKNVADFAKDLLEEKLQETIQNQRRKKKLSELAGIFYGGDGKTSENAQEILMSEIDKTSGFGK
ncbi:MAG: ribbon-helix-helix protein, CopG family [Actinomycetota bacterium]